MVVAFAMEAEVDEKVLKCLKEHGIGSRERADKLVDFWERNEVVIVVWDFLYRSG